MKSNKTHRSINKIRFKPPSPIRNPKSKPIEKEGLINKNVKVARLILNQINQN